MKINGKAKFNMPVCFEVEGIDPEPPIVKAFTTDDTTVTIEIPKGHLPKSLILWAKINAGWSHQVATPINVIELPEDPEYDLLVYNNSNEITGKLIIQL